MIRVEAVTRLLAGWWDNLSREQQQRYLKNHPRSKNKVNSQDPVETPAPIKPQPEKIKEQARKVAKGKAAHKAASVELSPQQTQAIKEYTGSMYKSVNPRLRAGKPVPKADSKDVKLVDEAFSKASTTEAIEVYRGVGATEQDTFANLQVGSSFEDKGFVSTSTDKDTADNFSRGDNPTILHIQVPAGSKAISVDSLSVFKKGGYATRSENEILLNRGGSYKVVSIKPAKRGQPRVVTVEYADKE